MKKKPHALDLILPPSNAHLRAIGLVAVQWGYLESSIDEDISALLKHPAAAGFEVNFMRPFANRTRNWRRLAQLVFGSGPALEKVIDISSRAKIIKTKRDEIVHGQYAGQGDPLGLLVYRSANLVKIRDISLNDLKAVAAEISKINGDLFRHQRLSGIGVSQPPAPDPKLTREAQRRRLPPQAKPRRLARPS